MSYFRAQNLSLALGQFRLRGVGLSIEQGQTLVLLGPSGSGKSVLLETIAGFHGPTAGSIELGGEPITHLPPEARGLGFMFQDYALFPHLTVEQNIAFGIARWGGRRNGWQEAATRRVEEVLALVGAGHLAGRRPAGLSGGEKQRVALARAMAIRPRLFLFDEPLSALDALMRDQLRDEMRRQLRALDATSLYVTHDRQEALMLADRIAIIEDGAIRQTGAASELFAHPADAWVAEFLGMQVLSPRSADAAPLGSGQRFTPANGRLRLAVADGVLEVPVNGTALPRSPRLVFRPEDVHLEGWSGAAVLAGRPDGSRAATGIRCEVEAVVPTGPLYRIDLHSTESRSAGAQRGTADGGARFHALLLRREFQRLALRAGDRVCATIYPEDLVVVPEREPASE